jgi:DNA mismatch repair protein MutS
LDTDILVLDQHTIKDLEIFTPDSAEQSLFQFCNLTRSSGGAGVLRRRMENPWSSVARIRHTQEAIAFIIEQREAFAKMPTAYATSRTYTYLHEVMPAVTENNLIEFSLNAFSLWSSHNRYYFRISFGVQVTSRLVRKAKVLIDQASLANVVGELEPLMTEMREILDRPRIRNLPEDDVGGWYWKILRLDQVFRIHEKSALDSLLQLIFEVEALVSMADVTMQNGFVMPALRQGPLAVKAQGLVHPFVPGAVANPVELDQNKRVLFLTGPNMAGKTTYLRAIATALYFAHLGMGVPATHFTFTPMQRLFSSISLSDDLRNGISYFRAEALRAKAIAQAIADGYRVVALLDEPFKGTNVKDALDASLAILERFASKQDCLFMFSSHLIELRERLTVTDQIDCRYFEADEGGGKLQFDYLLRSGVSDQRLGMRVLQEEGVFNLLDSSQ